MKFLIRARNTYQPERRYVLNLVLSEWLGVAYDIEFDDLPRTSIRLLGDTTGSELIVPDVLFLVAPSDWLTEKAMPAVPLRWQSTAGRPSPDIHDAATKSLRGKRMPILYGEGWATEAAWRPTSSGMALSIDVFGSVLFMLTRFEEVVRRRKDDHERFPAAASIAASEGLLERPLADEYVDMLWEAMRALWPALTRPRRAFRLRLTHDIDEPFAAFGVRARTIARTSAADLLRRRDPLSAARRARAYVDARRGRVDRDPLNTFDFLMGTSERHGLKATFYFLAGESRLELDGTYRLTDQPIADLIRRIDARGHQIGLHATYGTFRSPASTRAEFDELNNACASLGVRQQPRSVRQHFLRFEAPQTWRNHDLAGIEVDSTLAYADRLGFRAGTCREYPVFDLLDRRPLRLRESPLIVMDATLFEYLGLSLDEAASRTLALVATCRSYDGDAVLLFHNSTIITARYRGWYADLVLEIVRRTK